MKHHDDKVKVVIKHHDDFLSDCATDFREGENKTTAENMGYEVVPKTISWIKMAAGLD